MSFHEIRFPSRLSFGSLGGPERLTEVVTLANGFEERNTPWAHSRRRYDAGLGMQSLDDIAEVIEFFEARRGRLHGFRWKDWADWKSCRPARQIAFDDEIIGVGDGQRAVYQLAKTYRSGAESYVRPIAKPVAERVLIGVGGIPIGDDGFDLDVSTGMVALETPPPAGDAVSAGFEFDVPVRFDTDYIQTSIATFQAGEVPDVPVVELRT